MKLLQLFILFFSMLLTFTASTQKTNIQFEGMIQYKKITLYDTIYFNYFIKGDKVRIDKFKNSGKFINYKIINFSSNEIITINPKRKLYTKKYFRNNDCCSDNSLEIQKTKNNKKILGISCNQWIVKSRKNKSIVCYWVTNKNFNHFSNILNTLGDTEKISMYFQSIRETNGFIPIQSTETSWLRDFRMELLAQKIVKMKIDDSVFKIPKDYLLFK